MYPLVRSAAGALRRGVGAVRDRPVVVQDDRDLPSRMYAPCGTDPLGRGRPDAVGADRASSRLLALGSPPSDVYGVVSFAVAQRTRELGIRAALGATPSDIARLTMATAWRIAAGGVSVGVLLAFGIGRVMESVLFGTVSINLPTTLASRLFLGAIALVASAVPARRAVAIDPTVALRTE